MTFTVFGVTTGTTAPTPTDMSLGAVALFEKMSISQALQQKDHTNFQLTYSNQLILFDF